MQPTGGFASECTPCLSLHQQFRRPGLLTLRNIWSRWRLYASFMRASALLRQQSKALKRGFLEDQLLQAETAARKGDHRGLFLVAKRLGPRSASGVSRLQDSEGRVLDSREEMKAIIKHSQALFAAAPDTQPWHPKTGTLEFSAVHLKAELDHLNIRKAVPRHTAPNAVWRLCSEAVSRRLGPCFEKHFALDSTAVLEGDMKDAHVCWLVKPSKPPTSMSALRPIGLMPPCAKSFAGVVAKHILAHLRPLLDHLPQFAYCDGRGCGDAVLRAHQHFESVECLLQGQASNRFKMQQQIAPLHCYGGACFSLDLSSAFDMVSRDLLIQSLSAHQVPGILINAVQQLHRDARYIFSTATQSGSVTTTNGIKQGCRAAPTLWVSLTVLILEHLIQFRSLSWVQRILTLFADDFCGYWTLRSTHDLEQFIQDLTLLVETLELFQLKINLQKTALLPLHLKGKGARKLLEKHTIHKAGETFLRLLVYGTDRLIRVKDSHIYLGTVIAYHNRKDLNIRHRINAAQTRYQQIRKVLNRRGPISTRHRLRLWNACIPPCLLYSLEATGCTSRGLIRLRVLATRHLRAILRKPAHLSRISSSDIWSQARLDPPELSLRHRLVHLCQRRDPAIAEHCPDLVSNESVVKQLTALLTHLEGLISTLRSHETDSAGDHQATDPFPCEHCGLTFTTAHARLIHHSIKHAELDPPQDGRQKVIFSAPSHAVAGMPTCKLCGRNFPKWQQLRLHIEHGSCPALGGASHNLSPIPASNSAMSQPAHAGLPSAQPAQSPAATIASAPSERPEQKAAEMQVPLICQQSFKNSLHCWDKLLDDRLFRNRLRSYCVVCGMWIADAKHLKQHFNKVHQATYPTALEDARQLCLPFKSHFTRNRSCRYCGSNVGAPCRHVLQCSVLHQLCLAVSLCQPSASRQYNGLRSQLGNLCSLHAVGSTASIHVSGGGHATSETAAPGAGQDAWSHAGTHASAQAGLLDLQRAPSPISPSVRDATIAAGEPHPTSQQDCSQTRRTTGSTEEGYPVRPLHETGRQVDPPCTDAGSQGVENSAGDDRGPDSTIVTTHSLAELPTTGVAGEGAAHSGHGAGPGVAQESRLASERHRLDLSEMGPQAKAPGRVITGDIVTKFNSTVNLARLEEEGSQQAVFHLAVSLRGSGATEVHEQLCKLVGSSLTHRAACSTKKDDLLRPPQVKQLAQLTYGGGPPYPRRLAHLQLHPPATIGPRTLLSPGLPCIIPRTIAT